MKYYRISRARVERVDENRLLSLRISINNNSKISLSISQRVKNRHTRAQDQGVYIRLVYERFR